MKPPKMWDAIYETVDEKEHKLIQHFAARRVDWNTALMIKRRNKKVCKISIVPAGQNEKKSHHV